MGASLPGIAGNRKEWLVPEPSQERAAQGACLRGADRAGLDRSGIAEPPWSLQCSKAGANLSDCGLLSLWAAPRGRRRRGQ
jgi:hypothetical protein